jgi:hypothetical protein
MRRTDSKNDRELWLQEWAAVAAMEKSQIRAEWLVKCQQFVDAAFKLSMVWEHLDMEDNGSTAEGYPFESSFDEEIYSFATWLENMEEKWGK